MKNASKRRTFNVNYSCCGSFYICLKSRTVSDFSQRVRDTCDYSVSGKSSYASSYWNAGSVLSEINNDFGGASWDSRGNCCCGNRFITCVEEE